MKLIVSIIFLFISISSLAHNGEKLFGDISFGMTKSEVKKVVSANRDHQTFTVNGFQLCPLIGQSYYDKSELCILFLSTFGVKNKIMYEGDFRTTLIETDSIMNSLGSKAIYKSESWPNPVFTGDKCCTRYVLKGNSISFYVGTITSYPNFEFSLTMSITPLAYEEKINNKANTDLNNNIKEAKDKF